MPVYGDWTPYYSSRRFRKGWEVEVESETATTIKVRLKVFFNGNWGVSDSSNTFSVSGGHWSRSAGSISVVASNGEEKQIWSQSRTFDKASTPTSKPFTIKLKGLDVYGASNEATVSGSYTVPALTAPPATAPPAPVLSAGGSTQSEAWFTLSTPNGNGGAPINETYFYRWAAASGGSPIESYGVGALVSMGAFDGLNAATDYYFSARVGNSKGLSAYSSPRLLITTQALVAPDPVGPLSYSPSPPVRAASCTITADTPDDNGSTITGYRLEIRYGGSGPTPGSYSIVTYDQTWASSGTFSRSVPASALAGWGHYQVRTRIQYNGVWTPWHVSGTFTTAAEAPVFTSSGAYITGAGHDGATVGFSQGIARGSAITGYRIRAFENDDPGEVAYSNTALTLTRAITGLAFDTLYGVYGGAESAAGNSPEIKLGEFTTQGTLYVYDSEGPQPAQLYVHDGSAFQRSEIWECLAENTWVRRA